MAWVLSVTGIVALGLLLEILLPTGKTSKYIRGIFGLITLYVIISPLPGIIDKIADTDFEDVFSDVAVDYEFVGDISGDYFAGKEKQAAALLEKMGYEGVKVNIVGKEGIYYEIEYINVNLEDCDISADKQNIFISEIKTDVKNFFKISDEEVRIVGYKRH